MGYNAAKAAIAETMYKVRRARPKRSSLFSKSSNAIAIPSAANGITGRRYIMYPQRSMKIHGNQKQLVTPRKRPSRASRFLRKRTSAYAFAGTNAHHNIGF